jgi:hypothetical protein
MKGLDPERRRVMWRRTTERKERAHMRRQEFLEANPGLISAIIIIVGVVLYLAHRGVL